MKISLTELVIQIQKSIDDDNYKAMFVFLTKLIELTKDKAIVDSQLIKYNGLNLSPLGYALYQGKISCYTSLYKIFSVSPLDLINSFHRQGINPISFLCQKNYLELLNEFLPVYLEYKEVSDYSKPNEDLSPIQTACKNGHIGIICYLVKFFRSPPPEYNINYPNSLGETCAAISLQQGNYVVFKYIIEKCKGELKGLHDPIESCLTLSVSHKDRDYLECVMYLIETMKYPVYKHHLGIIDHNTIVTKFLEKNFSYDSRSETKESVCTNGSNASNIL